MDDQQPIAVDVASVLKLLANGELSVEAAMPYSSNYTLLARIKNSDMETLAIYKPRRGERPLWDFPHGTLYRREAAAYLVSEAMQFGLVPPTVVRDGPYGVGSLQLFIHNDEEEHLFTLLKEGGYEDVILRMTAFDCVINNADRKSGHCLKGIDGRLWAIDHGVCFHYENKLRTVLWDFIGEPFPADVQAGLEALDEHLQQGDEIAQTLSSLLEKNELRALRRRLKNLLDGGVFPMPGGSGPNVPWPPV